MPCSTGPEWIIGLGSFCLGALIGALVILYVFATKHFNTGALSAAMAALIGFGIVHFFNSFGTGSASFPEYWMYPVGLLAGAIVVASIKSEFDKPKP